MNLLPSKEEVMFAFRIHFKISIHEIRERPNIVGIIYKRALLGWYLKEICKMQSSHICVYLGITKFRLKKDINVLRQEERMHAEKVKHDKSQLNQLIIS